MSRRSIAGDAAFVRAFLETLTGPVVLVGHSYGGAVITNAATGLANVKALVYVNAFAPDQGEAPFALAGSESALAADPTTVFDFVPGTKDRIIPASAQRAMARRAGSIVIEYDAGHLGLMTDPRTVTQGIERAARASVAVG